MKTKLCLETTFYPETPDSASNAEKPGKEKSGVKPKDMKQFSEELCQAIIITAGLEKNDIHYKKAADYPSTDSDRILIECEKSGGFTEVCGIYVEDLYESYLSGTPMEQILTTVLKQLKSVRDSDILKNMDHLHSYEAARGDLFIRLLNLERHKKGLTHAVYQVIGDIALVLYMRMGTIDQCPANMKISRETAGKWNVNIEKIFQDALLNTLHSTPPRIYRWEKLIFDENYDGESFMNPHNSFRLREDASGNCLSTSSRTNGAVAVFLPGVAQRLSELLGHSFYMAFTSIHEVMIHSDTQVEPDDLREVLKETVQEATPEADFLSLKIYHYDKDTHKFSSL